MQNIFTAAKLVAILIIITGGAYKLFEGKSIYTLNTIESNIHAFENLKRNYNIMFVLQEIRSIYEIHSLGQITQLVTLQLHFTLAFGHTMVGTT